MDFGVMKTVKVLLLLMLLCTCAGAQSLLSGTVLNPDGSGFSGRLIFSLAQNASVSTLTPCTGPALVVPTETVTVTVTAGVLVSPPTLFSSTCTIPIGVPYNVTAIDMNGNIAFTDQWLVSGNPYNVGTAVSSGTVPTVTYQGLWAAQTTYSVGQMVAYGTTPQLIYVSVSSNNVGNIPGFGSTWQLLGGGAIGNYVPITGGVMTGLLTAPGYADNSRGLSIFASTLAPYTGFSDPGSRIAGGINTDFSNHVFGVDYADNSTPTVGPTPTPVQLGPYGFFPNSIAVPVSPGTNIPETMSGVVRPSPGVTYCLVSAMNVPFAFSIEGRNRFGGTTGTSTLFEPCTGAAPNGFVLNQYGTISALGVLGCPVGSTGCFSAGSQINHTSWTCLGVQGVVGLLNGTTQQGGGMDGDQVFNCPGGDLRVTSYGGDGGSQNQGPYKNLTLSWVAPAAFSVMEGGDIQSGGSYGASCPTITVNNCTTQPTFQAICSAGAVTGMFPIAPRFKGQCPTDGTPSISFSPAGASATPIIDAPPVVPALYADNAAGGTLYDSNSAVVGGSNIGMQFGQEFESVGNLIINSYSESAWLAGIVLDWQDTFGSFGNVLNNFKCEGANAEALTCLMLANGTWPQSFSTHGLLANNSLDVMISNANPRFYIPLIAANSGQGNAAANADTEIDADGITISTSRWVASTNPHGDFGYNCGSGGCSGSTFPHQWYPVTMINGDFQSMTLSSTTAPLGIAVNGSFANDYTKQIAYADSGNQPVVLDTSSFTPGDCIVLGTGANPVSGHDSGSNVCPTGQWHLGYARDDKAGELTSLPSAPATVTLSTVGTTGPRTVVYQITQSDYVGATQSPASSTMTITNAPAQMGNSKGVKLTGFLSGQYMIYRTNAGNCSFPSATFTVGPSGEASYVSVGTAACPDVIFPPTISFVTGSSNCSVYPTGTAQIVGGFWIGVNLTTRGTCTPNTTGTVTASASPYETGLIKRTQGASSYTDFGAPGDGSSPPSGGLMTADTDLHVGFGYNGTGTGGVVGPSSSINNDCASYQGTTGGTLQDPNVDCTKLTTNTAPLWLQYLGTGADGAESVTSGSTPLSGEKFYTTFNVSSGAIVTASSGLIIHATGACTVNGSILGNGANNSSTATAVAGGASGGSGGGAGAGALGVSSGVLPILGGPALGVGGTAGASSGGNGGIGGAPTANAQRTMANSGAGSDGLFFGGAASVAGANSGGAAVKGGTGVVLICASITGTGSIDVAGSPGLPPTGNSEGASSGGGAGLIILSSQASETFGILLYTGGGAGGQVSVPYAVPGGSTTVSSNDICTTPPVLTLGVTTGVLSSCTVTTPGVACGAFPTINWSVLGGGGSGGTITPAWSGGAVASCTASGGSGYTASSFTTAGAGGQGGSGWSAEFSGW